MIYIVLAIICGGLTIVSIIINANLGQKLGVFQGGFVNYVMGLSVTLIIIALLRLTGNFQIDNFTGIPFYAYLGGFVGVMVVVASNIVIPKIPAVYSTVLIFIGQIFTGLFIDYIRIGNISIGKIVGGLIIIGGIMYNSYVDKSILIE
ncbi:DMT family transporter [Clostridium tunisiense]|uniref:DMT family transporter n=1 Tax=Clostridium tunisiense TaxID=219748 RepID=UPI0002F4AE5A|nr:DMT family transporter [Clostridium tunisiense]